MNDVQYAWIVGFNSEPIPVAMSQMEYMVAACIAPIPDFVLMGGLTSQLILVRCGVQRKEGAGLPVVPVGCSIGVVFKHAAHELARAVVPKLTVSVSGCPPPSSSAWVLGLIMWVEADDVV